MIEFEIETKYLPQSFKDINEAKECYRLWLDTYNATLGDPAHADLFIEMIALDKLIRAY